MDGLQQADTAKMAQLLELHRQRCALLEELRKINTLMGEKGDEDLPDKILDFIGDRQRYLDEAGDLSKEIRRLTNQIVREIGGEDAVPAGEPALIWREIKEQDLLVLQLVDQIKEMDLQQERRMGDLLSQYKMRLAEIRSGRKAMGAYGKKTFPSKSIFVDKKD